MVKLAVQTGFIINQFAESAANIHFPQSDLQRETCITGLPKHIKTLNRKTVHNETKPALYNGTERSLYHQAYKMF
jgi:hypothetical protein